MGGSVSVRGVAVAVGVFVLAVILYLMATVGTGGGGECKQVVFEDGNPYIEDRSVLRCPAL